MLDRVHAGERGVYRFRAVFFSTEEGCFSSRRTAAAEQELTRRLSASVSKHRALSFVIADSRLLAPGSEARALFPPRLIERIVAGGGSCSSVASGLAGVAPPRWNRAGLRARAKTSWAKFRKILRRVL